MEDPFKPFREQLERRPEPPFEEKDWQNLQKRLDHARRKRFIPAPFWWWIALPVLLLSLGANGLLLRELKVVNQKIAALETQAPDTIQQTIPIPRTDTVFAIRVVREKIPCEHVDAVFIPLAPAARAPIAASQFSTPPNFSSSPATDSGRSGGSPVKNRPPVIIRHLALLSAPGPEIVQGGGRERPDIWVESPPKKSHRTLRQQLYALRPRDFQLGITGGWAYPLGPEMDHQKGFGGGFQAAVAFSPRLQLWTDATYWQVNFETDRMDDIPVVVPPADDFVFVKAEVPQPFWQFSAGLQYVFNHRGRWQPCVGAGFAVVAPAAREIVYEFGNPALGVEWQFERQAAPLRDRLIGGWMLRGGLEYECSRRWQLQLEFRYRNSRKQSGFYAPELFGIQSGVRYRF